MGIATLGGTPESIQYRLSEKTVFKKRLNRELLFSLEFWRRRGMQVLVFYLKS